MKKIMNLSQTQISGGASLDSRGLITLAGVTVALNVTGHCLKLNLLPRICLVVAGTMIWNETQIGPKIDSAILAPINWAIDKFSTPSAKAVEA